MVWCGCSWSLATAARVAACIALVTVIAVALVCLPIGQIVEDFLLFIRDDVGPWGPLVMILAYIPATVLALPGLFLSLGGGYIFGLPVGFVTDCLGATTGAVAAFIVGRTVGRSYVEKLLLDYPKFTVIALAIEKSSFKIVLLLRLVPLVPFNLLNYALALTPVPLTTYIAASIIGVMPMTLAFVYVGTTLKDISDINNGHTKAPSFVRWAIFAFGFLATVVATVVITKIAREALQQAIEEEEVALADEECATPNEIVQPSRSPMRGPVGVAVLRQPLLKKLDEEETGAGDDGSRWCEDGEVISRPCADKHMVIPRVTEVACV